MPRGSDETFFRKLCSALNAHAHFATPAPAAGGPRGGIFVIKHYAGDVAYSPLGLLDKNKDQLYRDLIALGGASRFELIASLFPEAGEKPGTQKRPVTAGSQFRTQIGELVARLNECEPHYIRCIKSNDRKQAGLLDAERVRHQVRYLGLLENVRVRRAGYAYRQTFGLFAQRYKLLSGSTWPSGSGDARQDAAAILADVGVTPDAYRFGKTKVFVKKPLTLFSLEELRERKMHDIARLLQAGYRSYRARKYFLELREKSLGIFHGRKRRRGSWHLYFLGDYIHAKDSMKVASLMAKTSDQRVLFADSTLKINRNRKSQERCLLITERALYTLTPGKLKPTNRVPLEQITGLSMSSYADGYLVVHCHPSCPDTGGADLVLHSIRKAEITTVLVEELQLLAGRELPLTFDDRLQYKSKSGGVGLRSSGITTRLLEFSEDAALGGAGGKAAVAVLDDKAKPATAMRVRVSPAYGSQAALQLNADMPHRAQQARAVGGRARNDSTTTKRPPLGYRLQSGKPGGGGGAAAAPPPPPPPQKGRTHGRSFSSFPQVVESSTNRVDWAFSAARLATLLVLLYSLLSAGTGHVRLQAEHAGGARACGWQGHQGGGEVRRRLVERRVQRQDRPRPFELHGAALILAAR